MQEEGDEGLVKSILLADACAATIQHMRNDSPLAMKTRRLFSKCVLDKDYSYDGIVEIPSYKSQCSV